MDDGDYLLRLPEANGVNIYATMALHGLNLKSVNLELDIVYKIMLVGKKK